MTIVLWHRGKAAPGSLGNAAGRDDGYDTPRRDPFRAARTDARFPRTSTGELPAMTAMMPGAGTVEYAAELSTAIRAARAGAIEVERVYRTVAFDPRAKADGSPVTVADLASDAAI